MKGAGSLRKEERKGLLSRTLRIGTGWGTAWETPEVELLHCGFPFFLCTYLLTPRDSEASVLTGLPQPLVWVLWALLHACFSPPALHIGPDCSFPGIGVQVPAQWLLTNGTWKSIDTVWWNCQPGWGKSAQSLNFHSAVSVSESYKLLGSQSWKGLKTVI